MNDVPTPSTEVDLASDPFADDLTHQLAIAAPKHWRNRTTLIIGVVVIIVCGFFAGIEVQKHYGSTGNATRTGFPTGTFPGLGRQGAAGGETGSSSAAPAANSTTGTIKLIDGSTVYVKLADGSVVTVKTSAATKVSVAGSTTVSKLKAGQKVTVSGAADSSGTVTATSVGAAP